MSDKVSLYQAIKDNWAQVTVAAILLGVMGGIYMEWRVESIVSTQLKETNVAIALTSTALKTDEKIIDMDSKTAINTSGVAENKEDIGLTQQQLRDVARVLMRPPGGDDDG